MLRAVDDLADKGIGMIHTASGVGFPLDLDVTMEMVFGRGLNTGFQSRVFFQTMDIEKVKKRKLPRIGGCFAASLDGCFGSEDAALKQPYAHSPNNRGILFYKDEEVIRFTKAANREGLQIEIHAIGDEAFDQAVMAIEAALKDCPRNDHRHGIIHACLPTEEGLQKCADLGIQIPLQPALLIWDLEPYEFLKRILGDRADKISPLRKMTDMGIILSADLTAPARFQILSSASMLPVTTISPNSPLPFRKPSKCSHTTPPGQPFMKRIEAAWKRAKLPIWWY